MTKQEPPLGGATRARRKNYIRFTSGNIRFPNISRIVRRKSAQKWVKRPRSTQRFGAQYQC